MLAGGDCHRSHRALLCLLLPQPRYPKSKRPNRRSRPRAGTRQRLHRNGAIHGGYDAANRAALQSAILLYQDGKYEEALKYLDKYSVKDEIIGAGARSLKGDCLVNLDRLDDAVKAFKDAISTSDNNPAYTPFFMMKLARVFAAQGKHDEEAKLYEEIVKDYPLYGQAHNIDVEKLLDRARLQTGK